MAELNDHIYEQITALCEQGDELADAERYAEAIERFWQAWDLLPEPQTEWEAATWILAAVGDTEFLRGSHEAAREALSHAMHCPDAPFCICGSARRNLSWATSSAPPTSSSAPTRWAKRKCGRAKTRNTSTSSPPCARTSKTTAINIEPRCFAI